MTTRQDHDTPPNVRLIGGEMLLWSDERPEGGAVRARRGHAVRELIRRLAPGDGSVLLIGPHPADFVSWVAGRAGTVAAVLRSHPDACRLGRAHAGRPGFTVYCGRLDKLPDLPPFDMVCALDGLGRVHPADVPVQTWRDTLADVARLVAPGGTLVLAGRNDLGIDAFIEAAPYARGDGDWLPPGSDPTAPVSLAATAGELAAHGLTPGAGYAAFPTAADPRVLLPAELLTGGVAPPEALVTACARPARDGRPVADPARLVAKAFRYGLADRLAPLWITLAHRAGGTSGGGPVALVEDTVCEEPWLRVCELTYDADLGGWWRRGLPAAAAIGLDRLRRDPAALDGPLPPGRPLTELLRAACAADDVKQVRRTLRAVTGELAGRAEHGMLPGDLAFVTTDDLTWDGDRVHRIDPSWSLAGPVPIPVALTRLVWRFADSLLSGGHHHPWPWDLDAERLTGTLLALCALPYDADDLAEARALDADIARTLGTPDQAAGPLSGPPETYREVLAVRERMRETLTAAQARIDRLEVKLTVRERELRRMRRKLRRTRKKVAALRRTFAHRAVRGVTWPLRTGARLVRRG
ncbi:class I SAM-dependent methyltransferase [Spongiactinospora rosea]|uniref:class I SAM-dependent methyltransferase n=1 Tax=Spongiactinospora rosea TaxID=2248750 RepID=UPI0011C05A3D|nr:class I SAM-dependent methyltransferase [Spongiactinospora rosea]